MSDAQLDAIYSQIQALSEGDKWLLVRQMVEEIGTDLVPVEIAQLIHSKYPDWHPESQVTPQ